MVTRIRTLKFIIAVWVILCGALMEAEPATKNNLNKAFYYAGKNIDIGRFLLLFDQKPIVNVIPDANKDERQERLVLFFPQAGIHKECKKMVDELNAVKSPHYTCKLELLEKPIVGLQLSIAYNPKKVGWDQRRLETIKHDNGVDIRLHDRELLEKIQKAPAPRVASLSKKKQLLLTAGTEEMTLEPCATV